MPRTKKNRQEDNTMVAQKTYAQIQVKITNFIPKGQISGILYVNDEEDFEKLYRLIGDLDAIAKRDSVSD